MVDQIGEGDRYRKLLPPIGICILNRVHFLLRAEYHSEVRLLTRSGLELINGSEIHLLVLPKCSPVDDDEMIADRDNPNIEKIVAAKQLPQSRWQQV